jgi:hypothetical protein
MLNHYTTPPSETYIITWGSKSQAIFRERVKNLLNHLSKSLVKISILYQIAKESNSLCSPGFKQVHESITLDDKGNLRQIWFVLFSNILECPQQKPEFLFSFPFQT